MSIASPSSRPAPGPTGHDVVVVGSAIVDLLVPAEPSVLIAAGLEPGTMTLIDAEEADRLWSLLDTGAGGASLVAGGSGANTAVGVAALGGRAALIGRVGDDGLGRSYAEDLGRAGVDFWGPPSDTGDQTGRCFVLVTPDGQRTMRTYLGSAPRLGPDCVDPDRLEGTSWVYLEGYLWDAPEAAGALRQATAAARSVGAAVALSLSDPGCVERHREEFCQLIISGAVDLVFGNESEALALWQVDDFERAVDKTRQQARCATLTRGEKGSVVLRADGATEVPAVPTEVVDTTGAGDLYAAGFLHGLCRGLDLVGSARLGALAAADVISAMGARPHGDIRTRARSEGLI